jgi:hypothetical protein
MKAMLLCLSIQVVFVGLGCAAHRPPVLRVAPLGSADATVPGSLPAGVEVRVEQRSGGAERFLCGPREALVPLLRRGSRGPLALEQEGTTALYRTFAPASAEAVGLELAEAPTALGNRVELVLTREAGAALGRLTERHLGERLLVLEGDEVLVGLVVRDPILGGRVTITLGEAAPAAAALAARLGRAR